MNMMAAAIREQCPEAESHTANAKNIFMGYIHSLTEDITNKFGHYIWRSLEPEEDCNPILERFKKLLSCISFYDGEIV